MPAHSEEGVRVPWKSYHERKADEAYEAYAGPYYRSMVTKRRECKTAADFHALSRACWKETDYAAREMNKVANMTRHGCGPYDRYSALYEQARALAIEFYKKARSIEGGA